MTDLKPTTISPDIHTGPRRRIFSSPRRKGADTTTAQSAAVSYTTEGPPSTESSQSSEVPQSAESSERNSAQKPQKLRRTEIVGVVITAAGVLLALFLLYLYVFSALTGTRNQNMLLHSLTGDPRAVFNLASGHEPRNGKPVAILEIPAIGVHQAVVEGTTAADLQMGPGLATSAGLSGLPGEPGNAIIAGRRVSFGGPFGRLSSLQPGDKIDVVDGAGAFSFSVTSVGTISSGTLAVPSSGTSWLTLVTSNSSWLPSGRLVVAARIIGNPAVAKGATNNSYALPSLSGDSSAGLLAVLWALAFIAILGLMVIAMRRWSQVWVSWLLAAPILLACGLFACQSLARCLPSTL
jgi:sortase A